MLPRHFAQPKQHIAIIVTYNCNNVIMPLYTNLEKPFLQIKEIFSNCTVAIRNLSFMQFIAIKLRFWISNLLINEQKSGCVSRR